MQVASLVAEQLKTEELKKLRNILEKSWNFIE